LRKVAAEILKNEGQNKTRIMRKCNITYTHVIKIIDKFKESGLVRIRSQGRDNYVYMTEKGREFFTIFAKMQTDLKKCLEK